MIWKMCLTVAAIALTWRELRRHRRAIRALAQGVAMPQRLTAAS